MANTLSEINKQLQEIEAQAAALRIQADEIKTKEKAKVIEQMRTKISEYGITASDLKLTVHRGFSKSIAPVKAPAKYRNDKGESWSGGRGRKPGWVVEALNAGKAIEDFAI